MTRAEAIAELVRIWHSPHLDLSLKAGLAEATDALKGEDGDLISRKDAIRWVKTECNPYGKPTLDFESGKKVIEHLEQMPSAETPTVSEKHQLSKETSTNTPTDLISRQNALDILDEFEADIEVGKRDSYKTHREKLLSIHSAYHPLCALADRACPFQGKEFAWCLTCPHISEEDRALVKKVVAEPRTGEWVRVTDEETPNVTTWHYKCDQCGAGRWEKGQRYCQNCGARMLGEDGEA